MCISNALGRGVAQVVELLPQKCEDLSSNPNATKKNPLKWCYFCSVYSYYASFDYLKKRQKIANQGEHSWDIRGQNNSQKEIITQVNNEW
jgi:hypothetical protein